MIERRSRQYHSGSITWPDVLMSHEYISLIRPPVASKIFAKAGLADVAPERFSCPSFQSADTRGSLH